MSRLTETSEFKPLELNRQRFALFTDKGLCDSLEADPDEALRCGINTELVRRVIKKLSDTLAHRNQ